MAASKAAQTLETLSNSQAESRRFLRIF